jgi:hypothetical protein
MKNLAIVFILTLLLFPSVAMSAEDEGRLRALEQRIEQLEELLRQTVQEKTAAAEEPAAAVAATAEEPRVLEEPEKKDGITLGGAVRVNYNYQDWNEDHKERYGEADFDTFRLNLDGEIKGMLLSAEYRFYPQDDWHAPHHAWVGYNFTDEIQGQLGIHQVPFGLQPYASHNFWFSGAYYVGLEDDYDLGLKLLYNTGPWGLSLAFYKNEELGNAGDAGRYSVDVINNADGGFAGAQAAGNEESNQINARLTHTLAHGDFGETELGVSGQWGQLYNNNTKDNGDHWAAAAHINGNYGRWNVQLMYANYEYNPENPDFITDSDGNLVPADFDDDIVTMGAYSFSWGVPAEAEIGIANVAYSMPVSWGPIDSLTFYSDNTVIQPRESSFDTIWQNVVGCLVGAGPFYTYVDVISGKNMIFMGGDMVGDTDASSGRNTRLNVNFGYYF